MLARECACCRMPAGDGPQTEAFGVVSDATCNPLFTVKLNCFVLLAKVVKLFIARYQTDRPMLPFLASDLHRKMKHPLYRFMKRGIVDDSRLTDFSELDLYNPALMRKTSDIDIRLSADTELKQM